MEMVEHIADTFINSLQTESRTGLAHRWLTLSSVTYVVVSSMVYNI
jgi:hypothetical protein